MKTPSVSCPIATLLALSFSVPSCDGHDDEAAEIDDVDGESPPSDAAEPADDVDDFAEPADPQAIDGGSPAFATAPEVVGLDFGSKLCSGITLSSRYILTAAHCVEDFVELDPALPPLFLPPPGREGVIDDLTVRVTFGIDPSEMNQISFSGSATVIVHQGWNPTNNDADSDDDIALIRTDVAISPAFRARLRKSTSDPNMSHKVTGWRPVTAGLVQEKTRGTMPFGAWNGDEGLKLNKTGSVTPNFGDSGGGASYVNWDQDLKPIDIYDGVFSAKVTGLFPGVQAARIPQKVAWIENVASPALGPAIDFNEFVSSLVIAPTTYLRIGSTP